MNSFQSQSELKSGSHTYEIFRLSALAKHGVSLESLPYSLRILLENLLRHEDGNTVTADDIEFLAKWDAKAEPSREIAYMPARVLMQDFTGVPAVVDLAAMRDAMKTLGGDPEKINPLQPAELVIDHSVQVDRVRHRRFLRHQCRAGVPAQPRALRVSEVGPDGVPQLLRRAARAWASATRSISNTWPAWSSPRSPMRKASCRRYPDTLVGTDSHTTMINGLGVLGWGVGGIEAEAAMLGQPVSMLVPQVVGFKLTASCAKARPPPTWC